MSHDRVRLFSKIYSREIISASAIVLLMRLLALFVYLNQVQGNANGEDLFNVIIFPGFLMPNAGLFNILALLIHTIFFLPSVLLASSLIGIHSGSVMQFNLLKGRRIHRKMILDFGPVMIFSLIIELVTSIGFMVIWDIGFLHSITYIVLASLSRLFICLLADLISNFFRITRMPAGLFVIVIAYILILGGVPEPIHRFNPLFLLSLVGKEEVENIFDFMPASILLGLLILYEYLAAGKIDYLGGDL